MDISNINGISTGDIKSFFNNTSLTKTDKTDSFSDVLSAAMGSIGETNDLQNAAEQEEVRFALGESDNTHDLLVAETKAAVALQYTVAVRDKKPAEPKSGTMQQDTKPDMKQMTGIDISGIIKTQPASAAPASKAGATTAKGTATAVSVKASDAAFGTPAGSSANADVINHTHEILKLYKSGKSNVEIAKLLSLGTGEVKLIIDLYKEGK